MIKIFICFPKYFWEHKASVVRRDSIRALQRSQQCKVHLSGPGWPDYQDGEPLATNVRRLLPGADAVLWYKPCGSKKGGVVPVVDPQKFRGIKIETFNETHAPEFIKEAKAAGTTLAVLHLENSLPQWKDSGIKTFVNPHCAEQAIFGANSKPWHQRDIKVLLTGTISDPYPLRKRLYRLIQERQISAQVRVHPGNYLPGVAACDAQELEYAQMLGRSKIVIGCTSKYRYRLARIPEIAMSGALVLSDYPDQDVAEHSQFIAEIHNSMTDLEICEVIQGWIRRDGDAQEKAKIGQQLMLSKYTQEHYCSRLIGAIGNA